MGGVNLIISVLLLIPVPSLLSNALVGKKFRPQGHLSGFSSGRFRFETVFYSSPVSFIPVPSLLSNALVGKKIRPQGHLSGFSSGRFRFETVFVSFYFSSIPPLQRPISAVFPGGSGEEHEDGEDFQSSCQHIKNQHKLGEGRKEPEISAGPY